jgi:GrpB-like predicted nucleotidyltransferase (UPF0157 family)
MLFRAEATRLAASIAPLALVLEHTGSTAVEGLAAKPVLDILAGYHDSGVLPLLLSALKASGYDHRGPQGIPEREFFRRGQPRSYHLHLTRVGSSFWNEHLGFRDRLRIEPPLREAYGALKLRLAAEHPRDREAYINGKTAFVRAALDGRVAGPPN